MVKIANFFLLPIVMGNQKTTAHNLSIDKQNAIKTCGVSTIITDKNKMKKFTIIFTVLIAMTIETHAQVPNGGFEAWESYVDDYTGFVYEKPDLWVGSLPNNTAYSFSIAKNLESYPAGTGQFSMKIQPDIANGVRGVALSNDSHDSMENWIPKPSFAIQQRPASLYLYYKYLPSGGDTMIAQVYFYKNGVLIGNPVYGTSDTISDWTALEIPMTYYNPSEIPDSATILFVTGIYIQHSESILYIDNLSFNGFVNSVYEIKLKNIIFNIYPNPSSDMINLNVNSRDQDDLTLYIYNSIGTLVKKEKLMQNQRQINIGDLTSGIYVLQINSKELTGTQKLLIQR